MSSDDLRRLPSAVQAPEQCLLVAEHAKDVMGSAAGAGEPQRPAVVATQPRVLSRLQRVELLLKFPRAGICLEYIRLCLCVLRLKVAILGFLVRQFGFDEFKSLAKDRRTAVLGDQALNRAEKRIHAHGALLW